MRDLSNSLCHHRKEKEIYLEPNIEKLDILLSDTLISFSGEGFIGDFEEDNSTHVFRD